MAMGLPVIATNWSGPTEYMTHLNSYPLDIDGLEEITEGAFRYAHDGVNVRDNVHPLRLHSQASCPSESGSRQALARWDGM